MAQHFLGFIPRFSMQDLETGLCELHDSEVQDIFILVPRY